MALIFFSETLLLLAAGPTAGLSLSQSTIIVPVLLNFPKKENQLRAWRATYFRSVYVQLPLTGTILAFVSFLFYRTGEAGFAVCAMLVAAKYAWTAVMMAVQLHEPLLTCDQSSEAVTGLIVKWAAAQKIRVLIDLLCLATATNSCIRAHSSHHSLFS